MIASPKICIPASLLRLVTWRLCPLQQLPFAPRSESESESESVGNCLAAFATLLLILTSCLALSAENNDTLREVLKRLLSQ